MDIRKISIFALTLQAGTVLCILCNHCALPFCHRAFDLQLFREFEVSLRSPLACSLTTLIQHVSVPVRSCQRFCQLLPNTHAPSNPNGVHTGVVQTSSFFPSQPHFYGAEDGFTVIMLFSNRLTLLVQLQRLTNDNFQVLCLGLLL